MDLICLLKLYLDKARHSLDREVRI